MNLAKTKGINGIDDVIHHFGILMPLGIGLFSITLFGLVLFLSANAIDNWNNRPEPFKEKVQETITYILLTIVGICVTYTVGVLVLDKVL